MAKICPKCGREFAPMSQSVNCPICKVRLVEDGGIDNSEQARKQRLQQMQTQRQQARPIQQEEEELLVVQDSDSVDTTNSPSALSIVALVFSILGCLSFIGTVLAIIDLCIKDGRRKVCSIIALAITCLWCLIIVVAVVGSDGSSNKPKSVNNPAIISSITQQEQVPNTNLKDTFGLMETAEMNNVQVTMTNYTESRGSEWNTPTAGNVFVLVEFEIANNTNSDLAISSVLSFSAYVDGYSTSLSMGALMENDSTQLDGTIAPGMKMRGWIGYEVPENWSNMEIHFVDNVWSSNKFKFAINK